MRTITVKGTGNVSARPDYIILSLNIETLSKTYDRAMSEAAERIEMILSRLVDTFSSRILYPMLLLSGNHSIAVV